MESLFFELGLVIISAGVIGLITYILRQPLILAYILAGILIGPFGFSLIDDIDTIHTIAQVGIMLMLFLIGLEMNPKRLREVGRVALLVGIGQVVFTGVIGYGLSRVFFGFSFVEAAYLAVALAMSSTVIAVKLIYDKHDGGSLYGQIAISVLLVQDVIAILALLFLSGFQKGTFELDYIILGMLFLKGFLMTAFAVLFASRFLGYIYNKIATSNELLILFSLGWAFLVALVSESMGFSIEVGAFIAGVSLAGLPYAFEINTKAKVIRDFFITMFFVALGAGMTFSSTENIAWPVILFSFLVVVGNPLIVMALMGPLGYDKKTSFFTGLSISNISEFSLILMAIGYALGHVDHRMVSTVTFIAIVTMTISSYLMIHNNAIYTKVKPLLRFFEKRSARKRLSNKKSNLENHIILLGCGQMGRQILDQIKKFKEHYLVVDHDNSVIQDLISKDVPCIFGDIEDAELLQELGLEESEIVISTMTGFEDSLFLIRQIEKIPETKRPIVIVTAETGREGLMLFNRGADYVILKPYLGAQHIHDINRELYQLEEDDIGLPLTNEDNTGEDTSALESDNDYARVLHNLNKLRLAEIKDKISKKHINLIQKTEKGAEE